MKNYLKIMGMIGIAVIVTTGCASLTYAQNDTGNHVADTTDNSYNYDNGYNDPQPDETANDYGTQTDPNSQDNASQQAPPSSAEPAITYDDFYSQLSPYGQWVSDPTYGRVWIPNVSGFQPYSTNGYWAYTNYGWAWVSNYTWGWAPFHYGRWGYDSGRWFWVPGYSWGPAWVAWSTGGGVYGWAPLSPRLHLSAGVAVGAINTNLWTFMPSRYMGSRNINSYYAPRSRNTTYIRNTTIINNYGTVNGKRRYTMGPKVQDVEKATGHTIERSRVVNAKDAKTAFESRNNLGTLNNNTRITNNRATNTPNNNQRVPTNVLRTNTNMQRTVPVTRPQTQQRTSPRPTSNVQMYRPQVRTMSRPAAPPRSAAPRSSGDRGRR